MEVRRRVHDSPVWARWGYLRIAQPACVFSRRAYEACGGVDPTLHCVLDTDLWYRLMRVGRRWGGISAYLAAYRLHPLTKGATLIDQYRRERTDMGRKYPDVMKAYVEMGRATADAGPLDARARELVKLGIAIGARLEGSAHAHVRKAREAGATPDEIRHVALLAVTTVGWAASVAAMTWIDEVLDAEKPAPTP